MKAIIKNIIYFTLYYTGIVYLFLRFRFSKKKNSPVIILTYHRIVKTINDEINATLAINHPVRNFKREMQFLKKWFSVVSLDEAIRMLKNNSMPKKPSVVIAFDDGFEDNYSLAYPVLKSLHIPSTIFLTTGLLDTNRLPWVDEIDQALRTAKEPYIQLNSNFKNRKFPLETLRQKRAAFEHIVPKLKHLVWSKRIAIVENIIDTLGSSNGSQRRMLRWNEVKEMSQDSVLFGAHTVTHPILSKMATEDAKKEIIDSKKTIECELDVSVKHFAFPNGRPEDFNQELKEYCKEIGFESICSCVYGNNKEDADVFSLKRISPGKNFPIFVIDLIRAYYR